MQSRSATPPPPTADRRWKLVEAALRRHEYRPEALLELLHAVQEAFGFIDRPALSFLAQALGLPPAKVYGVATFHPFFQLKPLGNHACVICTGTACYIKGAGQLLAQARSTVGIAPGETSKDGQVSLVAARCLGSCGLGPVALFDGEVAGKITPAQLERRLREWTGHEA
jgi:bidirectional [NiFe] hydrogenase diaphorase subunit